MPRFAAAHSNLGSILKEQGKSQQAIAHYQQAIDIDPMFAGAYSNLGNAYKDMGRMEDAIKCFTTSIRLKPDFADAYANLAGAYRDSHRVDDAITCYRKALSLRPDFPNAFVALMFSLIHICDWRGRSAHLQKVEELLDKQLGAPGTLPSMQPFHVSRQNKKKKRETKKLRFCYFIFFLFFFFSFLNIDILENLTLKSNIFFFLFFSPLVFQTNTVINVRSHFSRKRNSIGRKICTTCCTQYYFTSNAIFSFSCPFTN